MPAEQQSNIKYQIHQDSAPDGYIVDSYLGHGSFATVYRAHHKVTNIPYAIKVIRSDRLAGKLMNCIETEIQVLREMKHPNITELYAIERLPSKICLVMELCPLGDLSDYIKKNRFLPETGGATGGLSEVLYRSFLCQLTSAFKFIRSKNIIHRDLKPQNILLAPPSKTSGCKENTFFSYFSDNLPQLKVADFGFAKILPAQTLTETTCGSPLYMAPEVHLRKPYDARVDLWSIGTVLYEMVMGQPPFPATTLLELLEMIRIRRDCLWFPNGSESSSLLHGSISQQSKNCTGNLLVGKDIRELLQGLLKQDPENRITFEQFFNHPATTKIYPFDKSNTNMNLTGKENGNKINHIEKYFKEVSFFQESIYNMQPDSPRMRSYSDTAIPTLEVAKDNISQQEIDFENDCIVIEKDFHRFQITKEEKKKTSSSPVPASVKDSVPLSIQSPASTPCRDKPKKIDPGFAVLPLPKTLPSSLLISLEDIEEESTSNVTNTAPCFRKPKYNDNGENNSGYKGWNVGNRAAAIASAFSRASLKIFGARGLSPPESKYCSDSSEATSFPLTGPVTSVEEENVLLEAEQAACQAYALVKFANNKLNKLKSHTKIFTDPVLTDPPVVISHSLSINCQETFLLYVKALGLLYIGFDKISSYWSEISLNDGNAIVSSRLSRASRWLQSKTNECLEKAEILQSRMIEYGLKVESYNTDKLLYNYAIRSCQDGIFKEFKEEHILESESDYLMGLWMLQAILFRAPQDPQLSQEDDEDIRQMLTLVEQRIINFRKMLDECNLRHYAINSYYLITKPKS